MMIIVMVVMRTSYSKDYGLTTAVSKWTRARLEASVLMIVFSLMSIRSQ